MSYMIFKTHHGFWHSARTMNKRLEINNCYSKTTSSFFKFHSHFYFSYRLLPTPFVFYSVYFTVVTLTLHNPECDWSETHQDSRSFHVYFVIDSGSETYAITDCEPVMLKYKHYCGQVLIFAAAEYTYIRSTILCIRSTILCWYKDADVVSPPISWDLKCGYVIFYAPNCEKLGPHLLRPRATKCFCLWHSE